MTEPVIWRDLRAELNANQIAELEELEEGHSTLTDDHLLVLARHCAARNLDDTMVDTPPPPAALRVSHWLTIGGQKTREYVIAERVVGDASVELRGTQRVDSTEHCWITVVGDDPHLTVEQAHGLATALHELAAELDSGGAA